nr:phospholipase-like protein [Tanacetum cinerariifolium]
MAERLYVYNAKVSIRSRLEILQTIRAKLSWKEDRLDIFSGTIFGLWLNIQTILHDNHLLNFLLQHQRFISKPSTNQPFIFDIDGRTLEYGREDFCLITGFWFGKVNLDPDEEDHSEFRMRVFPNIENLKGEHLFELVNKDVKFAKLDDEDVVPSSPSSSSLPHHHKHGMTAAAATTPSISNRAPPRLHHIHHTISIPRQPSPLPSHQQGCVWLGYNSPGHGAVGFG